MRIALTWGGVGLVYLAVGVHLGGWAGLLIALFGLSCVFVGASYLTGRPDRFAKDPRGRRGPFAYLTLWPYLLLTWASWRVACHKVRALDHIHGWIWLGRRPRRGEIPPEVARVVDLTAELPPAALEGRAYFALPTLDKLAPEREGLERLLDELLAQPRPTLVHCAMGHGRSATVVAALLLRLGVVGSVEAAEAWMCERRPGVGLSAPQRQLLERLSFSEGLDSA